MKAFWGLYDDLSPKPTDNTPNNQIQNQNQNQPLNPPTDTITNNNSPPTTQPTPNPKKRKSEATNLLPRNAVNKKANIMAPRVARMAQRGIKETQSSKKQTSSKSVNNNSINQVEEIPVSEGPKLQNTNLTKALSEIKDAYDPSKPNDYLECCEQRVRKQQELERQREAEEQRLLLQQQMQQKEGQPTTNYGMSSVNPVAERLMKKMGWKGKGHGLGKNQQGITSALIAQKTGAGAQGIIINADANRGKTPNTVASNVIPSPVIVLRNMVGPGEVDEMLQAETAQECGKYGVVVACEVYESPKRVPLEEAVRIFVRFEAAEKALQALIDLDGRFFGGRTVRADYYPKDKFERKEFDARI